MSERDYYDVLGVGRNAGDDEIKGAFRKLARQYHPDVSKEVDAEEKFKEINEAYGVLADAEKRARYDRFGHAEPGVPGGAQGFDFSGFDLADALRAFMRDFGGEGGIDDLFGGRGRGPAVRRGDDLQVRLKLTLEEVATGVEKKIRVRHLRACPTCHGKGGSGEATCSQCEGRGQVRHVQQSFFGQFVNIATCPRCHGEGRIVRSLTSVNALPSRPSRLCRNKTGNPEVSTTASAATKSKGLATTSPNAARTTSTPRGRPAPTSS